MAEPTIFPLLAHATHWSHLLLYAAPVLAVLAAIALTAIRGGRAPGEAEHRGVDDEGEAGSGPGLR